MDSRAVQTQAYDEHHYDPHIVGSKQVAHGEEDNPHDHEKKSVLKKVKAKAKKIKDTITKHGHHEHDEHGHEYHYEDQLIPDDHDLDEEDDEDEEMVEDPEIHGAPIYESAAVRSGGTPGQVQNIGKPRANFGGTTVMVEPPPHHEPRVVVVSPTSELRQSRVTDPARTFVGEDHGIQRKVNLERPMGLEEDPHAPLSRHEAHAPANYQTKVTDPTGAGGAEIDITPVQKSLTNMTVHNEPKPNLEPKVLPTIGETQYPSAGTHHQFVPELSAAAKTHYPSAQTHDHNLPQLSSDPSAGSHHQFDFVPELSTATKTPYPSAQAHDHNNLPQLSPEIKTQYPTNPSAQAQTHDYNLPHLSSEIKTQYPRNPSYPYAQTHDHNLPPLSSGIETQYPTNPSTQTHDHNLPQLSSGIKAPYPRSHDQLMPELPTSTKTQYPSIKTHEQNLPELSSATGTHYPSAGSHDKFVSDILYTEPKTHYSSAKSHHDQDLPQMSSATNTQYPSVGSHDQFLPESTQTKTHYPYAKDHTQFVPEAIPTSTYSENPQPTTTTVEEQPQPHHESMEKPSNESSYTDKISSATSAIADKAITAKNAVASKLGYGEKDHDEDQNETRYHEENTSGEKPLNQSSYTEKISSATSAATSAVADKAVSAKNTVASKLGYGEKGDHRNNKVTPHEEKQSENNSNTTSDAEYRKNIALSLTEKLAPVYGKVAGVGSAVKSKVPGTEREKSGVMEQDKGVSVKDYLAEKLRPGVEEKALSEVISESLYKEKEEPMDQIGEKEGRDVKKVVSDALHKREEEPEREQGHGRLGKVTESEEVKRRLGTGSGDEKSEKWYQESYVNSPGKGVVDKVKDVVGSWFGNTGENQSSQVAGGEDLSKNSGAGVEQVSQAAGERRLQESSN